MLSGHFIKVKSFHPLVDSFLLGPRIALWAFLGVDTFLLGPQVALWAFHVGEIASLFFKDGPK